MIIHDLIQIFFQIQVYYDKPYLILGCQEVGVAVLLGELVSVDQLEGLHAGQYEVLADLGTQPADAGDEHARRTEPLLSVQAPKPDL